MPSYSLTLAVILAQSVAWPQSVAAQDPSYVALRGAQLKATFPVRDLELKRDAGLFRLRSGEISLLQPVQDRITMAVFRGEGEFSLAPGQAVEKFYIRLVTGKESIQESFSEALFCFTDATHNELKNLLSAAPGEPLPPETLQRFRQRLRRQREQPRSFIEAMLGGASVDNVEAEILADILNPSGPGFFSAYMTGRKFKDLRFHIRPRGALLDLPASEEVALIHLDPGGDEEAILYLAHTAGQKPVSALEKSAIDAQHYKIDTTIAGNRKLSATTEITFTAVAGGDRVIKLGLEPTLRVTKASLANGTPFTFIQEKETEDGSLFLVLPEPLVKGRQYKISLEYQGEKVVQAEGGGNFSVGARTSWYPNFNTFLDRATFDLTFRVPKRYTLVSVGKPVKSAKEKDYAFSQWVSEVPLAVAGFNYGDFKTLTHTIQQLPYQVEGYATTQVPDYLREMPETPSLGARRGSEMGTNISPSAMMQSAMSQADVSMRIFTHWFGPAPYGRIAITQQPDFSFGQSWPGLVYLPVSAFMDSTQRWLMLGQNAFQFSEFIQEVTPHEVAHQWWGHIVGWASYRDQWLSEGFSDFSAGIFLQATEKTPQKYHQFLDRWKAAILDKNQFGLCANDAGPISLGLRLNTPRAGRAYSRIVYSKGGYVLHMLRRLMFSAQKGDQPFQAMMKDFVHAHFNKPATTAEFQAVVEKHFPRNLNPDPDGKMDWFFQQWVHGNQIPSYRLEYSLNAAADGKTELVMALAQSGVNDTFIMPVPVYANFDGNMVYLGAITVTGSSPQTDIRVLLPQRPKEVVLNYNRDILAQQVESRLKN